MRSGRDAALRHFRTLFSVGTAAGLSDGELLERVAARRNEAAEPAFAALVERHGPMVLRVCRRVLPDPNDADDAFQATFLVLARRAGAIRNRDAIGSWLHGVALRVAAASRVAEARRRVHERRAAKAVVHVDDGWDDLGKALHEEVGRLPERFRGAVVLCCLEGHTYEEAARRLRCPVGTIKSRLASARNRLRARLERRGLAPAAGLFGAVLAAEAASASVPGPLATLTIHAASRGAASRAATAGVVPTSVAALAEGVLTTMSIAKWKLAAAAALVLGVAATTRIGVMAQEPAHPGAVAEANRLRDLEQKLDRILKAVERPDRAATPVADGDTRANGPVSVAAGYRSITTTTADAPTPVIAANRHADDRLTALERRLDQLERRLERVERKSGAADRDPTTSDHPSR